MAETDLVLGVGSINVGLTVFEIYWKPMTETACELCTIYTTVLGSFIWLFPKVPIRFIYVEHSCGFKRWGQAPLIDR
jgi:hypothetical protein